ncbi:MAG: flagellar hook-basal body complex protein [Sporolactobacillus sp.]
MALIRSLQSGVSGLKGYQTDLDVIGNNIANVDTTAYKEGRLSFADMMSQTLSSAQHNKDAMQVGQGTKLGSIDTTQTNGTLNQTDQPLDLAINGTGYFVLEKEQHPTEEVSLFTRDGHFHLDSDGYLVTDNGLYVQGRKRDATTGEILPPDADTHMIWVENIQLPKSADLQGDSSNKKLAVSSVSVSSDGLVHYKLVGDDTEREAGPIIIDRINNPEGLEKLGNNVLRDNSASGKEHYIPDADNRIVSGVLEASNVDLTKQMTSLIEAQRSYQANAETITTSDQILNDLVRLKRE